VADIDDIFNELVALRRWAETRLNVLNTDLLNMWNKLKEIDARLSPPAEVECDPMPVEECQKTMTVRKCEDCEHHGHCPLEGTDE
jgi:hypothetical protein